MAEVCGQDGDEVMIRVRSPTPSSAYVGLEGQACRGIVEESRSDVRSH